jgi:hypothetical protein
MGKNQHVVPRDGGWGVRGEGTAVTARGACAPASSVAGTWQRANQALVAAGPFDVA